MTPEKQKALEARVEVLEVQQAVMAGFISVLLQSELHHFSKPQQAAVLAAYDGLFERVIAQLLSSEAGFSDDTIRAIERLKTHMFAAASTG
jgi:hypothetical protein